MVAFGLLNLICGCWLLLGFTIVFGLSSKTKENAVNLSIQGLNYIRPTPFQHKPGFAKVNFKMTLLVPENYISKCVGRYTV